MSFTIIFLQWQHDLSAQTDSKFMSVSLNQPCSCQALQLHMFISWPPISCRFTAVIKHFFISAMDFVALQSFLPGDETHKDESCSARLSELRSRF